jgi:hypothetical protein
MNRALALLLLSVAAVAAACADSNEPGAAPAPSDDAGHTEIPAVDAGPDVVSDATPSPDADAALPTCTEDGWCLVALPNARSLGLNSFRVTGLAMDGSDGVWATTTSTAISDGATTSHLWHYENKNWQTKFGIGPTQSDPFPFDLKAIASNGNGSFIAVGVPGCAWCGPSHAVVLRVENGNVTAEYPPDLRGLRNVIFTSSTEAWALDDEGRLYRTTVTGAAPLTWTLENSPHPPDPDFFNNGGPDLLIRTNTGGLLVAGDSFGNGPAFTYADRREIGDDGNAYWTSSTVPDVFSVQAGVAVSPSNMWLAAGDLLVQSHATDAGVEWTQAPNRYPTQPQAMWASSPSDVWAVASVGRIYRYDGTSWADTAAALNGAPLTVAYLYAITGLPSGEMWIGGQDIAIHRLPPKANP